jgi:hypothetical protein
MTQVIIKNIGNFEIPNEKAEELKTWLNDNEAVKTPTEDDLMKEVIDRQYKGSELICG